MPASHSFFALTPAIQFHIVAALGALLLGPVALRARKGSTLHRTAGYTWVLLMLAAATTSLFIRDFRLPNIAGYTPIHILTAVTFIGVGTAMVAVVRHNIARHRLAMRQAYLGGCVIAGLFTLMPGRFFGQLVWGQWLGLM